MPKRRKTDDATDDIESPTSRKTRRTSAKDVGSPLAPAETPSKRKPILRPTPTKVNGTSHVQSPQRSVRKVLFSTPAKPQEDGEVAGEKDAPTTVRNDRSARRKSARALQRSAAREDVSDEEQREDAYDTALAEEILDDAESEEDAEPDQSITDTPSKRGRPKGRRRERTPSPPPVDLPAHELYFFQNRAGANKTSSNTLPAHQLLNHEDYFVQISAYKDPHEDDIGRLHDLHKRAFDQWMFELDEGFNLCLYGYGSKRQLAMEFAEHLCYQFEKPPQIVIVNGYTPGLTIRDILTMFANIALPKNAKLPAQAPALLDLVLSTLPPATQPKIALLIHSLDHVQLRKSPTRQYLARLASHPSISLLATVDTPSFPLLWDTSLTHQYRWLYHDTTTFRPYSAELPDVVEDVQALLGRRGRRALGGKGGVAFVLRSLPENARNLFRILVGEQLALWDSGAGPEVALGNGYLEDDEELDPADVLGHEDEAAAAAEQDTPSRRGRGRKSSKKKATPSNPPLRVPMGAVEGVEYRALYHKAVEEFVCSSELNFRTLLKEFHDHQMIESRKDVGGAERLVVPFGREELEGILEELV